jgi:ABC-type Fe3+-hydroxamate transport system substrate-binding protein
MATRSFSDQLGNITSLTSPPQRIISLVPSQTELLADLGLDDNVVGITKFCVHPLEWRKRKNIVGGTKNFHFDTIDRLQPDLIIGNKEENYKEGIERLRERYPVWMSDIFTLQDALFMIETIGLMTETEGSAKRISDDITSKFESIKKYDGQSVLYLIWRQPWMAAGKNTFIDSMLTTIGLTNVIASYDRYPTMTSEQITSLAPQYILLSSEPYPFNEQHSEELRLITPASRNFFVDGEMFSWYGSRLRKAPDYFNTLGLG